MSPPSCILSPVCVNLSIKCQEFLQGQFLVYTTVAHICRNNPVDLILLLKLRQSDNKNFQDGKLHSNVKIKNHTILVFFRYNIINKARYGLCIEIDDVEIHFKNLIT